MAEKASVPSFRRFMLNRIVDMTGVSGTGVVAVGAEFPSGRCVMEWLPGKAGVRPFNIYQDTAEIEAVNGHDGATVIEWMD